MKKHKIFSDYINLQKNNSELILTTILIAIGVNLLSSGITEIIEGAYKAALMIISGLAICIIVIIRIICSKLKELRKTAHIEGFILYDSQSKKILPVPEYQVSNSLVRYLKCAFAENNSIEKLWNSDSINVFHTDGKESSENPRLPTSQSGKLLLELLEYCVIHKLSVHLMDHFRSDTALPKITTLKRNDIPKVLLSNRFLNLFSEDMQNRAAFVCTDHPISAPESEHIISAYNISGALYEKFDLILPQGSTVLRQDRNKLVIDTPMMKISIDCIYSGYYSSLKSGFRKHYLGLTSVSSNSNTYKFYIDISVNFKLRALFSKDKELYYAWVDSFIDELDSDMSKEAFFERINWDTVYTLLLCNENAHQNTPAT